MRHHLDLVSLLLGLAFVAVAVAGLNGWVVDAVTNPDLWRPEVVLASGLVVLGLLIGALTATMLSRRRREGSSEASADAGVAAGPSEASRSGTGGGAGAGRDVADG